MPTRAGVLDVGIDGLSAFDAYHRIAAFVYQTSCADAVYTYEIVRCGRQVVFADVHAYGPESFREVTTRLEGQSVFDDIGPEPCTGDEVWPGPLHRIGQFRAVRPVTLRARRGGRAHWSAIGAHSAVAMSVPLGDTVLGGVVCLRLGPSAPFERSRVRALRQAEGVVRSAFVEAWRRRVGRLLPAGTRSLLALGPHGQRLAAAKGNADWVQSPRTLGAIREAALEHIGHDGGQWTGFIQRAVVQLAHLAGEQEQIVATIEEPDRYRPGPRQLLTQTQRRVADLAIAGATIREIAGHLARSQGTVHHHLKGIYERLGVASRLELAQVLTHDPGELRPAGYSSGGSARASMSIFI